MNEADSFAKHEKEQAMYKIILMFIIILAGLCPANSALPKSVSATTPSIPTSPPTSDSQTRSLEFSTKLGNGWNLGNSFDSHDWAADQGEQTWDNPVVTQELLRAIKAQGFDSIRLPFTVNYRADETGVIDPAYLGRYQEVVDWALAADLYVIINIHHDSIEWLQLWDGQRASTDHQRFASLWRQLAQRFKEYDNERVLFEAINEPRFDNLDQAAQQKSLAILNHDFHRIVRQSGGENTKRMLLLTTLLGSTEQPKLEALKAEIDQLADENLLATVHYYSEWHFSNNVGYPLYDEALPSGQTPRQLSEDFIQRLNQTFIYQGIGVVIGEYGLLGYDRSDDVNPIGETYKYIAHLNQLTRYQPISLFLWDNGQHFDRLALTWRFEEFGDVISQSMHSDSAYGTFFNTSYLTDAEADLFITLSYNGANLDELLYNGKDLLAGRDFEVNQDGVYLYPGFAGEGGTLTMRFTQGATWNQQVKIVGDFILADSSLPDTSSNGSPNISSGEIVIDTSQAEVSSESVAADQGTSDDTIADSERVSQPDINAQPDADREPADINQTTSQAQAGTLVIPVEFAGHDVKRINLVTGNQPIPLTYLEDYQPDVPLGQLTLSRTFLATLGKGRHNLVVETFAGGHYPYTIIVDEKGIRGLAK
ncbi:cellulase family glycosylhydrolase [Fundicoccus sp. Sow4_D5]|uniref:cellulase family glycosylhydrolase n=1 Tax=Fundicoccus sp. Sow4_D5 TaxID=3438782 RepID=UPI003F8E51E7